MSDHHNPYEDFLTAIERSGRRVNRRGPGQASAQCTTSKHSNNDSDPSLSVSAADCGYGCVLLYCQIRCDTADVLAALGWRFSDLFHPQCTRHEPERKRHGQIARATPAPSSTPGAATPKCDHAYRPVAEYPYFNADEILIGKKVRKQCARCGGKTFYWLRPSVAGGGRWKTGGPEHPVLYRLPQVLRAAAAGGTVYIVEGEKDVAAAERLGLVATCNPDGAAKSGHATKWKASFGDALSGAHAVIVADNDAAGLTHAAHIAADLATKAASVRIVRAALDTPKADLTDHLEAGHPIGELVDIGDLSHLLARRPNQHPAPPAEPPKRGHLRAVPDVDGTAALAPDDDETTFEYHDDGNALRLIDAYRDVIRYCPERGRWLTWKTNRWVWCSSSGDAVREYAKQLAREIVPIDSESTRHRAYSLSARGVSNTLVQAETDPRITVAFTELDAHPWELNTPAGIVDLRTGEMSPPDPAKLHTKTTSVSPDPTADPSVWIQFLADTFGEDEQMIAYVQRLIGYSATGTVGRHVLPFCFGSGGNGKGVCLEATTKVLGDYATTTPNKFLMARQQDDHETAIARLAGMRMVLCSEVNQSDRFDEAKIKQLTGGDTLTARFMRQDHFTFEPTHHLWLMGNHYPEVRAGGDSFWRRLRLIPFTRTVPEEKRVDGLQTILATEHGPALLSWIIAGAVAYHQGGLNEPEGVAAATKDYAAEEDAVGRFIHERCRRADAANLRVESGLLRSAYEKWCVSEGVRVLDARVFGRELKAKFGIERKSSNNKYFYAGLGLLSEDEEPDRGGDR